MIHVMNPYQMSSAMFRLATLSLEYQMQMMQTLSKMSMAPLSMTKPQTEPESGADVIAAATPAARRSHGAAVSSPTKSRRPRKPSRPPEMPKAKSSSGSDDVADNVPV
ncbi:hypothetical protein [Thalassovita sp.]|uniref:hypothetical protein n=1 Tax=Thalassovita sp. TaxID=1979401 RepID=UPI002B26C464|nr:hypothetical protein [Thalassovita sp.]